MRSLTCAITSSFGIWRGTSQSLSQLSVHDLSKVVLELLIAVLRKHSLSIYSVRQIGDVRLSATLQSRSVEPPYLLIMWLASVLLLQVVDLLHVAEAVHSHPVGAHAFPPEVDQVHEATHKCSGSTGEAC